jgi:hypothetical protein
MWGKRYCLILEYGAIGKMRGCKTPPTSPPVAKGTGRQIEIRVSFTQCDNVGGIL